MDLLDQILHRFESSRNIREKRKIQPIIEQIKLHSYRSDQIYASLGEDAAAIRLSPDSPELVLLTTDALIPEFIQASPWAAGFAAIYVGIDDIVACGGRPIACSTTVSYQDKASGDLIFQGILDATQKFRIPLIRGHTTTDAASYSLTSTVLGYTSVERYVSAGGAKVGDTIGLVFDVNGKKGRFNPLYWDTITAMQPDEFWQKRRIFQDQNAHKWINACKDISNGGILGTLYQMLNYAALGAKIYLQPLVNNANILQMGYSLTDFLFAYLTSAFLVAVRADAVALLTDTIKKTQMNFLTLGEVIKDKQIEFHSDGLQKKLFLTEPFI
jgi:hypothetical protein